MQISDINRVVEQVSRDKGIERNVLIKALEEALKSAARKKFGSKMDIEVQYNEDSGEIEVFQFKDVAENVTEPALEISLEEGRKLDPDCEIGDSLGTKMDTSTFGRIAAQSAKQVIIQKMKDAEKDAVYSSFIDRKGDTLNGIVQRIDRGDIIVNLGHTEGVVPVREQVPKETYRRGDRIRAYILDVLHESRGPQIILSRTHPNFLIHLFRTEVPEITEGIVTIMGAAREPGIRAKFAVASNNSDIDPVGACVGMKGSRVQNVVQELRGEKIDIIPWHIDPAKFVCNALAPAEISRVIIDEANQSMEVIVPDEFLSIAIGKKGQNVRLASKLTGWHLDVKSETKYSIAMQSGYDSLVALPGIGISMADALYELGLYSAEEVSNATPEDLIQVRGIGEETAKKLIAAAQTAVLEAQQAEDIEEEKAKEADTGETDGTEGEQEQTDSEKDTAPPDGASQNDQTDSADGDEPEKAETDIAEAAGPSEDEAETAETDSAEAAEQSEDEAETAETDSAEAAEQSEDKAETAETDSAEAAEQSEDKPENAESDKENQS
jgi:N utilization substance protein A